MSNTAAKYTHKEELWNFISHALGIALGIGVGLWFIISYFGRLDNIGRFSIILFILGMLSSYIASTTYHAIRPTSKHKARLRKCDHAAIYLFIAGSYSPITLIAMRDTGAWGWTIFGIIWLCAIIGVSMSFRKMKVISHIETICYVIMGLLIVIAFKPLLDSVPLQIVLWIIGEGICYITGAIFYSVYKRPYMHTVFHFFVLAGSICHIIATWAMLELV